MFRLEVKEGAGNSGKQTHKRAGDDVATTNLGCTSSSLHSTHATRRRTAVAMFPSRPLRTESRIPRTHIFEESGGLRILPRPLMLDLLVHYRHFIQHIVALVRFEIGRAHV